MTPEPSITHQVLLVFIFVLTIGAFGALAWKVLTKDLEARMLFGFLILAVLGFLAVLFAIGKIEESSSFGLMPIVVSLTSLGSIWATWAFTKDKNDKP